MRILVLNYEFPPIGGGASPVTYDLCKYFARMGDQVDVITMRYRDLPKYEQVDNINIYRVKCLRKKKDVCYPWEQFTYIYSAIHYIKKNLNMDNYDIVHAHFIIPTAVIALYLKYRYKKNYIITAHGSDVLGHNNSRFALLYKILKKPWCKIVREAKYVVSPSKYLLNLMEKSEKKGHYIIIRNGIDTHQFYAAPKKKQILVMCRLQATKRVEDVINALSYIGDMKDWKLIIAGDGPQLENLKKLVNEKQLNTHVKFVGWIQNKSTEHLALLAESYIYISASELENCPISVLEAKCSGCQLILSDIAAHKQLIEGENIFFKCGNYKNLAKMLSLKMKNYCEDISTEVENMDIYDWKNVINLYKDIMTE